MSSKRVVLGREWDERLWRAAETALKAMPATKLEELQGVAGSQDIRSHKFACGEHVVELTAETYLGISLEGDAELVDEVARQVRLRLGA